jgi:large subunit ribosomal protein L19e
VQGTSRGRTRTKLQIKKKHGTGPGSKKGKKTARVGKKEIYVIRVRSMRRHLKILKERKDLTNEQFWNLYKKVNGAQVRSLSHLRELVRTARAH